MIKYVDSVQFIIVDGSEDVIEQATNNNSQVQRTRKTFPFPGLHRCLPPWE